MRAGRAASSARSLFESRRCFLSAAPGSAAEAAGEGGADAARALAAPGDTLEQLAQKAKAGLVIDLGDLTADSPLAKSLAAAFVLPPHEISQPTQTELGWHLFEVTALTPETVQAFETVKDKVRDALAQEKAVDAMYDASVQLEDQVAAGTTLPKSPRT